MYNFYLDDVFTDLGMVLDAPQKPDKCELDPDYFPQAMQEWQDGLCAADRIRTREELDEWLTPKLVEVV